MNKPIPLDEARRRQQQLNQPRPTRPPPPTEEDDGFFPSEWQGQTAPPVPWMVKGCFIRGTVAILAGDGGLGKSMLMQQFLSCAAMGFPWLGLDTTRVRGFGLFCEESKDDLHRRQQSINKSLMIEAADLDDALVYRARRGKHNVLVTFDRFGAVPRPTKLWDQIRRRVLDMGAQAIVLDPTSRIYGGNKIFEDQIGAFVDILTRLAMEADGCVILTKHVSRAGAGDGHDGALAWSNAVRTRLWLTGTGGNLTLKTMKQNYGKDDGKIPLRWDRGVFDRFEPQPARDFSQPTFNSDFD